MKDLEVFFNPADLKIKDDWQSHYLVIDSYYIDFVIQELALKTDSNIDEQMEGDRDNIETTIRDYELLSKKLAVKAQKMRDALEEIDSQYD